MLWPALRLGHRVDPSMVTRLLCLLPSIALFTVHGCVSVTEWTFTLWWIHSIALSVPLVFPVLHIRWIFPFLSCHPCHMDFSSPVHPVVGIFLSRSSFLGFSSQGYFLLVHHPIYSTLVCNKRIRFGSAFIFSRSSQLATWGILVVLTINYNKYWA